MMESYFNMENCMHMPMTSGSLTLDFENNISIPNGNISSDSICIEDSNTEEQPKEETNKGMESTSVILVMDDPKTKWLIWNNQLIINGKTQDGTVMSLRLISSADEDRVVVQVLVQYGDKNYYYNLLSSSRQYLISYDPTYNI